MQRFSYYAVGKEEGGKHGFIVEEALCTYFRVLKDALVVLARLYRLPLYVLLRTPGCVRRTQMLSENVCYSFS